MRTAIDLPDELHAQVKAKAIKEGLTISEVAKALFEDWLAGLQLGFRKKESEVPVPEKKVGKDMGEFAAMIEKSKQRKAEIAAMTEAERNALGIYPPLVPKTDEQKALVKRILERPKA